MAAVLSCGPQAALSHAAAAALWELQAPGPRIDVSVPISTVRRRPGIVVHRRRGLAAAVTRRRGIPVTDLAWTLADLAGMATRSQLEPAIRAADTRGLSDPEALRGALEALKGRPGAGRLRRLLDRRTFRLTDSELERRFLRLARRAGLPPPRTQERVNGFRVDFWWPELGLVVETDGLTYHRTPAQQARDRIRDQAHTAAGLTPLRFTHEQVRYEPRTVAATLSRVARRLAPGHG
jgi:very-short-patch-repair endonuclease